MALQWKDGGKGAYVASDERTGLTAYVSKEFSWFITDLSRDNYEDIRGIAGTVEEAMAAIELALSRLPKSNSRQPTDAEVIELALSELLSIFDDGPFPAKLSKRSDL